MLELSIAFFVAFIVSFVASMQPGPVNLAVLSACLQKKTNNAFLIAIGGSWPEFVFCFIAIKAASLVTTFSYLYAFIQIAIALIFIVIAVFLWFSKSNHITKSTEKNGFLLGSVLAILNPQLILFWTTVIAYIHINNFLGINLFESYKLYLPFCLGAAIGAFCLHVCIIYLSKKFSNNTFDFFVKYIDKIIALIFVMLAIIQIIKIIQTWQK